MEICIKSEFAFVKMHRGVKKRRVCKNGYENYLQTGNLRDLNYQAERQYVQALKQKNQEVQYNCIIQ